MLEQMQKHKAFLQQVNPVLKLFSLLLVIAAMVFVFDPWTPLAIAIITAGLLRWLGGVPWRVIGLFLIPLSFFAISFVWISILFPQERGVTVLFHLWFVPVTLENIMTGVSLGFRSMVFGLWSLLFVLTTEPTKLMLSLIMHCKLPPRYGYGMMAAYRFLPLFQQELNQIRAAHRIRGLSDSRSIRGRWEQMKRYAIPLLAGAIRKAERVAIAMESKGFDGSRDRTYYRNMTWSLYDIVYGAGWITIAISLICLRQMWV